MEIEIIPMLFYPLLATIIATVLVTAASIVAVRLASKKVAQVVKICSGLIVLGGIIACIVCMHMYYVNEVEPSGWYEDVNTYAMLGFVIVLVAILAVIYFFLGKKHPENDDTRTLVFGAIALAMSFALSYARLFKLPQGGTITFASLLPIMIYSYMFGIRRGMGLAIIYGVLQAVQDPWIIHPLQFLLDYPLAFAFIGITGIFKELGLFKKIPIVSFILGGIVAVIGRYISHVGSGIFAFASYAGEGYTAVAWGFLYNTFAFVDMAIAIVAGCFLFVSRTFVTQVLDKAALGLNRQGAEIEEDEEETAGEFLDEQEDVEEDYEENVPVDLNGEVMENEDTTKGE